MNQLIEKGRTPATQEIPTGNGLDTLRAKGYEPPRTLRMKVETEGGFCASVIDEHHTSSVEATKQQVNTGFNGDFSDSGWDSSNSSSF